MKSIRIWMVAIVIGLIAMFSALPPRLNAQVATGTIIGTVKDSSGAVVPNANISARSVETGAVRKTVADSNGEYQIPSLPPGGYDVEASFPSFSTQVRPGTSVTVGATVKVDFTLTVGSVTQTVQVSTVAPQVNATNASMGGLVGQHAIRELPLNGRDWLQLATLQAGVTGGIGQQTVATSTNSRAARGNGLDLYISGNRGTANVFLVDGLVVNDQANASPGSGLNINLGVEAIREFRVLTDEYPAQYGRAAGGVVTAVFKSGTNEFHGSVYEFLRNSVLDARNFFDTTKPPFRRNQFGASAGGPIKKGKTFIFGDYEGLREEKGLAHSTVTLSPNARNGILQCVAGVPACANGAKTFTVKIAPSIVPYLGFFPAANGPITGDSAKFNFAGGLVGNEDYTVVKIDQNFSDRTTLSGSFQYDNTAEDQPDPFNLKLTGSPSRHFNTVVSLQHIFSPNLLNTARMGVSRSHVTDSLDVAALNPIAANTSLGFLPGLPAGVLGVSGLDTNLGGLGGSGADILNYTSLQWSDDVSWIRGKNSFEFGGNVERIRYNKNSLVGAPLGEFDFDTIALFLQGIPSQFTADFPGKIDIRGLRQTYEGLYFQDEIAVRSNLHVNIGLRYEHVSPVTEQNGLVAVLPTLASSTPRTGGAYYNTNTLNFAPRLGVSWDPTGSGRTAIRAGFGIYDVLPFPYLMENRTNSAPFFLEGNTSPSQNPLPASSFPAGGLALISPTGLRASFVEQNPHRAYNQAWNLTIQRQLTANFALTVGYVGSHAVHLPRSIEDANEVPFSLVTFSSDGHLLFPTKGPIQKINSNFARIATTVWDDSASYHSLVVDFNKRFSRSFRMGAAYTWSKSIDFGSNTFSDNQETNTSGNPYAFFIPIQKGPADFDIAHRFVVNYTWDIPTPSSFSGASRALLGGWELGGVFTAQTGPPFSVTLSNDQARTGDSRTKSTSGGQRPNFNAIPGCTPNAINPGNPDNYIKLQCFSYPALGQLGNLGRNTLRGPGLQDFDFSIFKNWPLLEKRLNLQFRTEVFNIFNRPNFQMPKTQIFDGKGKFIPTAPVIPSPTLTDAREIQFGVKVSW
jgi:Carboxypeptidase regulatory-like domain/TonB dependent receptor